MLYVRILMFQSIKLYFINEEDKGGRYWIYQKVNKTKDKMGGLKSIFEIFVISSKPETCIEFSSRQTSVVQRFWTAWPSGWFSTRIQSQDVVKLSETGNQSTTNCFRSICNYHVNYWRIDSLINHFEINNNNGNNNFYTNCYNFSNHFENSIFNQFIRILPIVQFHYWYWLTR